MAIPATTAVQFVPLQGKFEVDALRDPSGAPLNVLDIDQGFTFKGRVELPSWLTGTGLVRLSATEIGGEYEDTAGEDKLVIDGAATAHDPGTKTYDWSITVTSPTLPDPSPDSGVYYFVLSFIFVNPAGGHTDIGAVVDLGVYLVV